MMDLQSSTETKGDHSLLFRGSAGADVYKVSRAWDKEGFPCAQWTLQPPGGREDPLGRVVSRGPIRARGPGAPDLNRSGSRTVQGGAHQQ